MTEQYGENGFVPTVTGWDEQGDTLVLETLDPRPETDLICQEDEEIKRRGDTLTDEQQEKLALRERQ